MPEVAPGEIIAGKYRVEHVLGQGGMARVMRAVHTDLDQHVAIKTLLPEVAWNAQVVQRFLREAKAAAKIRSEHVARVFDVGRLENGEPFMVLEYLEGTDLACWVEKHGPMPVRDAVDAIIQACDAIAHAHAAGVVHRDLKPSNLFFATRTDGSRKVKVIDFGIAKQVADDSLPAMTGTADVFGSPQYMSPEQIRGARDVDGRTDIWALGVALYELLAGRAAFDAESVLLIGGIILTQEPAPVRSLRSDVPEALEAVIGRCLRKTPGERFATAGELAEALAPFASEAVRALLGSMPRLPAAARLDSSPDIASEPRIPPAASSSGRVVTGSAGADTLAGAATQAVTVAGPPAPRPRATPLGVALLAGAVTLVFGGVAMFVLVTRTPRANAGVETRPLGTPAATSAPISSTPPSSITLPPVAEGAPSTTASSIAPSEHPAASASARRALMPAVRRSQGEASAQPLTPPVTPPAASTAAAPPPAVTSTSTMVRDRHGGN